MGTRMTKPGSEEPDLLTYRFTGSCLRRSRAGSSRELSAKEVEWTWFSSPVFAGCIHFLEALLTILPDSATPQQAGNEGKEESAKPGIHAWAMWPSSITGSAPVWKVQALFISGILLPGESPRLGLTGSEGAVKQLQDPPRTQLQRAVVPTAAGPAGGFDYNPAISRGQQGSFGRGVSQEPAQRGLAG